LPSVIASWLTTRDSGDLRSDRALSLGSMDKVRPAIVTLFTHDRGRYAHPMNITTPDPAADLPPIRPDAIGAGLGLASREEICGLIGMIEAASTLEIGRAAATSLARLVDRRIEDAGARMTSRAKELFASTASIAALRHRLWLALVDALEVEGATPLSTRRLHRLTAALGVQAAKVLSPELLADEQGGWLSRTTRKVKAVRQDGLSALFAPPLSFPDVVAREFASIFEVLGKQDANRSGLDPKAAEALRQGRASAIALAAAGGGWAGLAAVVSGAGFAPYILAAHASAVLPFVGGSTAISFLTVAVNPVTLLAGLAGSGFLLAHFGRRARGAVAARAAVLLALRGLEDQRDGIAALVSAFRRAARDGNHADKALATRLSAVERRLGRPLPDAAGAPPGRWAQASRGAHDLDSVAAAATGVLCAGDMMFHAAAIDPKVLAAADFSRTAHVSDPFAFAAHAGDWASRGAEIGLRGYAAERVVLARLIEDGHDASIAPDSNTPGFDLIVDGAPVQVKCGLSLDLLRTHFAKYPDIPVIADAELAAKAAASGAEWASMVATVDGFALDQVEAMTAEALDAAGDLADPAVAFFALSVGAARGAFEVWRGEIPLSDLPAWLALDGAVRATLTGVGAKAGAVVGLVAIGPAGAVILGPMIGAAAL
jgi:hypothetical protein